MTFPSINTKATNIELTPEIEDLLEQKLQPLDRFLPEGETDVKCDVELECDASQQSGDIFRAEINLFVGGTLYRAEATEDQIEKAVDRARDGVKREVRRARAKRDSLVKRGGRKLKEMMRFGGRP